MAKQEYKDYITANYGTYEKCYGQCKGAVEAMHKAFPELRPACGYVSTIGWGVRAHWWLVAEDNSIIDPTVIQFPGAIAYDYDEWQPGKKILVGTCCNCSNEIWEPAQDLNNVESRILCSPECERLYAAYVMGE